MPIRESVLLLELCSKRDRQNTKRLHNPAGLSIQWASWYTLTHCHLKPCMPSASVYLNDKSEKFEKSLWSNIKIIFFVDSVRLLKPMMIQCSDTIYPTLLHLLRNSNQRQLQGHYTMFSVGRYSSTLRPFQPRKPRSELYRMK